MDTSNAIGRIIGSSLVLQKLWEQRTWSSNRKSHIKGLGLLFGVSTKIVGTSKLILHLVVQLQYATVPMIGVVQSCSDDNTVCKINFGL